MTVMMMVLLLPVSSISLLCILIYFRSWPFFKACSCDCSTVNLLHVRALFIAVSSGPSWVLHVCIDFASGYGHMLTILTDYFFISATLMEAPVFCMKAAMNCWLSRLPESLSVTRVSTSQNWCLRLSCSRYVSPVSTGQNWCDAWGCHEVGMYHQSPLARTDVMPEVVV